MTGTSSLQPESSPASAVFNKAVQRTGVSRFTPRQVERCPRAGPVADLCVDPCAEAQMLKFKPSVSLGPGMKFESIVNIESAPEGGF